MAKKIHDKLKIVFFPSDCALISGSSQCMYQLVLDLMELDTVEPHIIFPYEGEAIKLCKEHNIPFDVIKSWGWCMPIKLDNVAVRPVKEIVKFFLNFIAIIRIYLRLKKVQPDLIHNNTSYCYVGPIASYLLNIPVVWQLQEWMYSQGNKIWMPGVGFWIIGRANQIVAISQFLKKMYLNVIPNHDIKVVYDGLEMEQYYCTNRNVFQKGEIRILCLGGICYQKGQNQTIEALAKLCDKDVINWHLNIVGEGAQFVEFNDLVKKYGLNDKIKFCGKTTEPAVYYKDADILICNSQWEAFGRVTVEAMLAGCLVIASDSGANPEILGEGKYGLLYKYGDIEDLANKIEYAISHKEEMRALAKAGQKHAVECFDSRRNAKEFYEVYMNVCNNFR